MPHQLNSLHLRLLLWLLVILATIWAAAWFDSQKQAADTARADIDRQLQTSAFLLLATSASRVQSQRSSMNEGAISAQPDLPQSFATMARVGPELPDFEISDANDRIIQRTKNFPDSARHSVPGYQNRTGGGRVWRVLTVVDHQSGLTCRVAADQSRREARAASLNGDFAHPLLWLLPVLLLGALGSVWQGLAPLRKIEKAISRANIADPSPLGIDPQSMPRELRRLIAVLDELFERLQDLLARQRRFTEGAAHELRTPLAGAKIQLHIAQTSTANAAREHALQQAQQAVDQMARLVGQLLLLVRIDADPSRLKKQRFDCCQIIRDISAERQVTAEHKNVSLHIEDEPGRAMLYGDTALISTMFANIIDNAIEFSPPGASVGIGITMSASTLEVRVHDQGPGIDPCELDHVFERFYRGDRGRHAGTGLGLAIVHAVIKAHAGDVRLKPGLGGGTVAIVRLPAYSDNNSGDTCSV